MKKILVLICLLLILGGCNVTVRGERVLNGNNSHSETSISSSYDSFKGIREYKIEIDDKEDVELKIDVKTTKGKIKIVIYQNSDDPIYTGTISEDKTFSIGLKGNSTYYLKVETTKHCGSYSFDWSE